MAVLRVDRLGEERSLGSQPVRFSVRQYAHLGALARLAQLPTELKTDTRHDIVTLPSARSVRNRCAMGKFGRACNAAGKPIGSGWNLAATAVATPAAARSRGRALASNRMSPGHEAVGALSQFCRCAGSAHMAKLTGHLSGTAL
jgi:hypothetical protein